MKRTLTLVLATLAICTATAGILSAKAANKEITVVSRESGSGTRGAFIELFGVEQKKEDGSKKDMTTKEALIANKTDVMLTNIANDPNAIGYVSLGSLNDTVKALAIDGITPSSENVKNGTYPIARPFIIATKIATKDQLSPIAKDFISFILSQQGQTVVANGYIAVDQNAPSFQGTSPKGKITIAGSSSVTPIMEKLKEAYLSLNPHAKIEIQMSDSTAGMTAAANGTCDIGMASRQLKQSELSQLTGTSIALDGIAVIVNASNPTDKMTSSQIKDVFTGKILKWDQIK